VGTKVAEGAAEGLLLGEVTAELGWETGFPVGAADGTESVAFDDMLFRGNVKI